MNQFYKIISIIKKIIAANLLFAILIAVLSLVLVIRAMPDNHIDFESAENIMAMRWWIRDGFFKHHFLMMFNGYGEISRYFEEPELNEHASGSAAGGLLGHKLNYYTHYPSLFLVPVALIMKLGITQLFLLRIMSIIASILGLIFLYVFFEKLSSNKYIAFIASAYFGISPIFIGWADIIQYVPFEDMWRSLILMLGLIVMNRIKAESALPKKTKYYLLLIWAAYFLLSLTSFNSTFFIFTWLIGLSAIYIYKNQNIKNKIWLFILLLLFWASAPVLGFIIQLIQNISYLGWHNTWLDIGGAFTWAGNRTGLGLFTRFDALIRPFFSMTGIYNFYTLLVPFGITKFKLLLIFLLLAAALSIVKLKKISGYRMPSTSVLVLLAVAPLAQTFILPYTGFRDYMGRLYAPFIGIIIGITIYMLFILYKNKKEALKLFNKIIFFFLSIVVLSLFIIQIVLNSSSRFYSSYAPLPTNDIVFAASMQKISSGEKAVFMINASDTKIPEEELKKRLALYNPAYVQTNYTIWGYYLDMPLLNFTRTSYLVKDLLFLEKRSGFPFTAIITSDDISITKELYTKFKIEKLQLSPIKELDNRYFFTITPVQKIK